MGQPLTHHLEDFYFNNILRITICIILINITKVTYSICCVGVSVHMNETHRAVPSCSCSKQGLESHETHEGT